MNSTIDIKRIYETPSSTDGKRVLVDRIWPRGVSLRSAALDLWLKEIAPSTDLRKWFGHDAARFAVFRKSYRQELDANRAALAQIYRLAAQDDVTLLYAAHDRHVNHAFVLAEYLKEHGCKLRRALDLH